MIANKRFIEKDVLIDGEEFYNCHFERCRIVFRGVGPVQFEECVFNQCEWVFDGPAENTLLFLAALATDLGEEAAAMVRSMLGGIASGEVDKVLRRTAPPVAV